MRPDDGRVVSNFIVQALKGKDITVYGDGMQTRSFMYVDDLVEAMVRYMKTDDKLIGPMNLGNSDEVSIIDLANTILKKTQSKSKIIFSDLPKDDPIHRKPDISFAKKSLNGWEPKISCDEGLEKTIEYFKNLLSSNL